MFFPNTMNGMRVIESPLLEPQPILALSSSCPCSESVREDFNRYLIDMFGMTEAKVYMHNNMLYVAPSQRKLLNKLIDARS